MPGSYRSADQPVLKSAACLRPGFLTVQCYLWKPTGTTHNFEIFAFLLVDERTGLTLEPLQFGAPVTVPIWFIASVFGLFFAFFRAVANLFPLDCKSPDSHGAPPPALSIPGVLYSALNLKFLLL